MAHIQVASTPNQVDLFSFSENDIDVRNSNASILMETVDKINQQY